MKRGYFLHRLAACVCSPKNLERVVEPAIADLQREQGFFASLTAYLAVLTALGVCAVDVSGTTDDERRMVTRTLLWSVALTAAMTATFVLPPLYSIPEATGVAAALLLVPQAVPLAIPIGLAFGIAFVMSRRVTLGAVRRILLAAFLLSTASFAVLGWGMPAANQAFRELAAASRSSRAPDAPAPLQKGAAEMTFSELRREIRGASEAGEVTRVRRYSWMLHLRLALGVAAIVVAGLLLSVPIDGRVFRVLLAVFVCLGYWLLLFVGERTAHVGNLWPVVGAWLPNVVLVAVTAMIVRSVRLTTSAKGYGGPP